MTFCPRINRMARSICSTGMGDCSPAIDMAPFSLRHCFPPKVKPGPSLFPLRFLPPQSSDRNQDCFAALAMTGECALRMTAARGAMSSGDEPVIVGVAADPEPQDAIVNFHA